MLTATVNLRRGRRSTTDRCHPRGPLPIQASRQRPSPFPTPAASGPNSSIAGPASHPAAAAGPEPGPRRAPGYLTPGSACDEPGGRHALDRRAPGQVLVSLYEVTMAKSMTQPSFDSKQRIASRWREGGGEVVHERPAVHGDDGQRPVHARIERYEGQREVLRAVLPLAAREGQPEGGFVDRLRIDSERWIHSGATSAGVAGTEGEDGCMADRLIPCRHVGVLEYAVQVDTERRHEPAVGRRACSPWCGSTHWLVQRGGGRARAGQDPGHLVAAQRERQ